MCYINSGCADRVFDTLGASSRSFGLCLLSMYVFAMIIGGLLGLLVAWHKNQVEYMMDEEVPFEERDTEVTETTIISGAPANEIDWLECWETLLGENLVGYKPVLI